MTFSIVARDPSTGALGVATATAGPAVGALVPHARAGAAAVATQALTNPYLAIDLLKTVEEIGADAALAAALANDTERDRRQVVSIDVKGQVAGWTGASCGPFAAHRLGHDVAVAGNLLTGEAVLEAMLEAFESSGTLTERLLRAMTAGRDVGGDRRGLGSAAMLVVEREDYAAFDLRVDLADDPLGSLAALHRAVRSPPHADFVASLERRLHR